MERSSVYGAFRFKYLHTGWRQRVSCNHAGNDGQAADDLINGINKLSGSGGFVLGKLGLGVTGAGGIKGGLETITVSTAEGAFLGGGLGKVDISALKELNKAAYGQDFDIAETLSQLGGKLKEADGMRAHLKSAVVKAWAK